MELFEATKIAAAAMAENLNLTLTEDITDLCEGNTALIVTSEGINAGTVTTSHGEMRTYRYDGYYLNGMNLYTEEYKITEQGWADTPTLRIHIPEDTLIYIGY